MNNLRLLSITGLIMAIATAMTMGSENISSVYAKKTYSGQGYCVDGTAGNNYGCFHGNGQDNLKVCEKYAKNTEKDTGTELVECYESDL
jgi:hypothetical protein